MLPHKPSHGQWCDLEEKMEVCSTCKSHRHGEEISPSTFRGKLFWIVTKVLSLPFYLLPRRGRPVRVKAIHELHPMSYLDALRGYLALIIFTAHTMYRFWKWIPDCILAIPWFQFPFRGGYTSLNLFFFISGYAVTYRIVGLMQTKKHEQLLSALASSIFRRYFRLFLPILPVVLVTAILVKLEIALPPPEKDKIKAEIDNPIWWWIKDCTHIVNPFTEILGYWNSGTGSRLLDHTWTLGTEFRSSMIMSVFCTGTCKLSTKSRKILLLLALPPFIAWQANWAAMAFVGMWFSECRQERTLRQKQEAAHRSTYQKPAIKVEHVTADAMGKEDFAKKPEIFQPKGTLANVSKFLNSSPKNQIDTVWNQPKAEQYRTWALVVLFLYSFFVLKDPYDTEKMTLFPHNYLNLLVPTHWNNQMRMHMHLCIGGVMMMYSLDRLPTLQKPLLMPFSQFLGELSFGIYAVHITVSWIVWKPRYVDWATARYGTEAFDYFWVAFPAYFCMAILVLWAAEAFRRVDVQVVRFCKWLEQRLFEE